MMTSIAINTIQVNNEMWLLHGWETWGSSSNSVKPSSHKVRYNQTLPNHIYLPSQDDNLVWEASLVSPSTNITKIPGAHLGTRDTAKAASPL